MKKAQSGSILLAIILMMPFIILIAALYMELTISSLNLARRDQTRTHAQLAADAGIDASLEQINQDGTWTGTSGEVGLHNDGKVRTTYQVTVNNIDSTHKSLTSIGRAYRPVGSSTPDSSIQVEVRLRGVQSGSYSIVSGVGGLTMRNSSKVVNGSIYINGRLTMSNTAQIGLGILPVNVKVAHQSCPTGTNPGPTYPQVCGSGNGQPISISHSAHIYGDVLANNQTNGSGMSNGGLCPQSNPSCDYPVPAVPLPDYDRDAQKAAVATELSSAQASCSVGVKTWAANTKINGNANISNTCVVTVEGNVWITGNFDMRNLAILRVRDGLSTPPVIMVDGSSGLVMRNGASMIPNLSSVGFRIITYYSTASCSPDCSSVTGTSLYNSQNHTTIDINNSASGAQTEFYARWTRLVAGNSGNVGALAAQTVELSNGIAVTFGTSVSGFGDTVWVIDSYRRTFD